MNINRLHQKSIIVISHSYKPVLNPRAFRWSAILEEWAKDGTKIDVITSWQPGMPREEVINNVHIFRVNDSMIEKLRAKFIKPDRKTTAQNNNQTNNSNSFNKNIIKFFFKKMHDLTWKNLYWPDYACLWKKSAIRSAEYLLTTEQYDTMITISDPFTSHLVGYNLKEKFPHIKWLVDIGDPFCFRHDTPTNNHVLYWDKNYKIERSVFAKSDYISVTTESTKVKYAELFPESAAKIEVIPPLMAPLDSTNENMSYENNNKIKLIFVGTLYKAIRNPKFLLQLHEYLLKLDLSENLELHFYGGINDCQDEFNKYKNILNKNLFVHGLVPREEVLSAMEHASALINIGNDNMYQLPSKIVEYVLTGKPIINIAKLNNDTSSEFLNTYPSKLLLFDNKNSAPEIEFSKCKNYIENLPSELSEETKNRWKVTFSAKTITKQYQKLMYNSIMRKTEASL